MKFKKAVLTLHLWLGMTSGMIVVILGITGCIYAFIEEITPLAYSDKLFVDKTNDEPLPITDLIRIAQDQWGKDKPVKTVEIYTDKSRSVHLRSFKDRPEPGFWYWDEKEFYESIYIDPYSGSIISHEDSEFDFFRVVLYLHYSLLLNNQIGKPIVGIATLIFIVSLISGLVLWWPKNAHAKKSRLWFKWKSTTGWKKKNFDLHNIPGFYSLFFALIIAFTGLFWAFSWIRKPAKWIANTGHEYQQLAPAYSDTTGMATKNSIQLIYNSVTNAYPNSVSYYFYLPRNAVSPVNVVVRQESNFSSVTQQYDQYSGELLRTLTFGDKNPGEKLEDLNYDIHVGSIGGIAGKILAFVISLISASLPITGFLIWYNRKWGKKQRKKMAT